MLTESLGVEFVWGCIEVTEVRCRSDQACNSCKQGLHRVVFMVYAAFLRVYVGKQARRCSPAV